VRPSHSYVGSCAKAAGAAAAAAGAALPPPPAVPALPQNQVRPTNAGDSRHPPGHRPAPQRSPRPPGALLDPRGRGRKGLCVHAPGRPSGRVRHGWVVCSCFPTYLRAHVSSCAGALHRHGGFEPQSGLLTRASLCTAMAAQPGSECTRSRTGVTWWHKTPHKGCFLDKPTALLPTRRGAQGEPSESAAKRLQAIAQAAITTPWHPTRHLIGCDEHGQLPDDEE